MPSSGVTELRLFKRDTLPSNSPIQTTINIEEIQNNLNKVY